jgi:hypothetical protein
VLIGLCAAFAPLQIRFFLLQNRQGKTRLSKWYVVPPEEADRLRMEAEIHRSVTQRDRKYTNFVEVRFAFAFSCRGIRLVLIV